MSTASVLEEIKKARGAHAAWKLKLKTALSVGRSAFHSHEVKCDQNCEFGKWIHGPTLDFTIKTGKPYQVIRRLHAEFHDCAGRVLEHIENNNPQAAQRVFEVEYALISDKLSRALTKWQNELVHKQFAA